MAINRVAELRKSRATLYTKMQDFLATKDASDDGMSSEDTVSFDSMKAMLDALDVRIARLEDLNSRAPDESEEVKASDDDDEDEEKSRKSFQRTNVVIKTKKDRTREAKGTRAARFLIGAGIAKANGSLEAGMRYVADRLDDAEVSKALASNVQIAGGATIPAEFRAELIELLYAQSVVRQLGATIVDMTYGNVTIPRLNSGATAYWVAENNEIPTSQPVFDDINMSAKKLGALVPCSNDLLRRSPLQAENIIRNDMVRQLALAEDAQFLTGVASATRPGSLMSYAGNMITATVTGFADVNNLLNTLIYELQGNNVSTVGAKWIASPLAARYLAGLTDSVGSYVFKDDVNGGNLFGSQLLMSNQIPTNLGSAGDNASLLFYVQPSDVLIGETLNMTADSSSEASYNDGSANPQHAFQRDQTLFRIIEEVDMNVRHPQSIVVATVKGLHPSFAAGGTSGAPYTNNGPPQTTGSASKSANPSGT